MVTIQTMLPTTFEVFLTKDAVFETRETMEWRVVGGTMSTRAAMRSNSVSSAESSEDTEDSDSLEDVRDDEVEAYGLLPLSSFSSMISTLTMVRANSVIFVTLCDLSLLSAPPPINIKCGPASRQLLRSCTTTATCPLRPPQPRRPHLQDRAVCRPPLARCLHRAHRAIYPSPSSPISVHAKPDARTCKDSATSKETEHRLRCLQVAQGQV